MSSPKEPKRSVCLRLRKSKIDFINASIDGATESERISNFFESQFYEKKVCEQEIQVCETRLKILKDQLKKNIFYEERIVTPDENKFWYETIELLEKEPQYLLGRKQLYCGTFKVIITLEDFKILYNKKKEELHATGNRNKDNKNP